MKAGHRTIGEDMDLGARPVPMESAIMGLSGFGVSFIPSTMALIGLRVLLAMSEDFTSHLSRRLLVLAGYKAPLTLTWWKPLALTPIPFRPLPVTPVSLL